MTWPPTVMATVWRREQLGTDGFGEARWGDWEPAEVVDVVYAPGATSDLEARRPEGTRVSATVHFPKGYSGDLRRCQVELFGERYRVVGDPMAYPADAVPGEYNLPVELEAAHG